LVTEAPGTLRGGLVADLDQLFERLGQVRNLVLKRLETPEGLPEQIFALGVCRIKGASKVR